MNKLSLLGMQLPEKYKENFDVSSEGPSCVDLARWIFLIEFVFSFVCS